MLMLVYDKNRGREEAVEGCKNGKEMDGEERLVVHGNILEVGSGEHSSTINKELRQVRWSL